MFAGTEEPRALHLYDCADVGATLVQYGRAAGQPWRYLPARETHGDGTDVSGSIRRVVGVAEWTARRWLRTLESDLLHIHFGTRLDVVTRRPGRPFVVHYHGTDIRTFYHDPSQREKIQWGADNAAAVLYSTPDLKIHAEAARSDAIYLPNPVNLAELPAWEPSDEPLVVFSSRWDGSKGGDQQLELLAEVRRVLGPRVRIEGLDWGESAREAQKLGADLVPKMSKERYLRWLSRAHCIVGQTSGILAMSELQSIAIGIPLVARLEPGYYPDAVPVLGGGTAGELAVAVASVLEDPTAMARQLQARRWIDMYHAPEKVVNQLASIYRRLT